MKTLSILCLIALAIVCFNVSSYSADWNFYGSIRMATIFESYSKEAGDKQETVWALQSNSRIGGRVKVSDILSGGFEYGAGPNLRLLYADLIMNDFTIRFGQHYNPTSSLFYSNQMGGDDSNLFHFGNLYSGRNQMVQISRDNWRLAFVKPVASAENILPKIEGFVTLDMDDMSVDIFGGFQTLKDSFDNTITSIVAGAGLIYSANDVTFKTNGYYAINAGQYGIFDVHWENVRNAGNFSATDSDDCHSLGAIAALDIKTSPTTNVEGGIGFVTNKLDVSGAKTDSSFTVYLQSRMNIAPGFTLIPEVSYVDFGKDHEGDKQGNLFYAGAQWRLNL